MDIWSNDQNPARSIGVVNVKVVVGEVQCMFYLVD